jgi:molybdopterin synthase catalytic subunit
MLLLCYAAAGLPTHTGNTIINTLFNMSLTTLIQPNPSSTPQTFLQITPNVLDILSIIHSVSDPICGAISTFHGITRGNFNGKEVLYLEYECYESMAKKQLTELCLSLRLLYPSVHHIAISHRIGRVNISESSVIIAVSAPHRVEAIQACEYAINQLKASVPIWKLEYYADGSSWKQNQEWQNTLHTNHHPRHQQQCLSCKEKAESTETLEHNSARSGGLNKD